MLSLLTMSQTADDDNDDQNKKEENSQYNGCYFSGGKPCAGCGGSSVPSSGCQKNDDNVRAANQKLYNKTAVEQLCPFFGFGNIQADLLY